MNSTAPFFLVFFLSCCRVATSMMVPDPVLHFSVGAVAGGAGAVAAYPFDYIKSQMQTEYGKQTYRNGWDALVQTLQANETKNPVSTLYKGVGVQVLGIAPEKGIKLGVNDVLASAFLTRTGSFPLWSQIVSGGVAGACQVIASSPLEVMKVGLQTSDMDIRQVWQEVGGVRGLFRGAEACILRDVLFTAICFPLYAMWTEQGMNAFAAGALSGVIASFAATPPDVIKTRILSQDKLSLQVRQTESNFLPAAVDQTPRIVLQSNSTVLALDTPVPSQSSDLLATQMYNMPQRTSSSSQNPLIVGKEIIDKEGPSVLLSGVSERCLGAIPRFGTTLALHDVLEDLLNQGGWLQHCM